MIKVSTRLFDLIQEYLRPGPVSWSGTFEDATLLFDPPLTAAEQLILDDLVTMARFGVTLSLDEWRAIKADAAGLKAYLGLASPTNAQTVAATKGIIRVLGTIIRS